FTFRVNDGTQNSLTNATVTVIVGPPPAGSADVSAALATVPAGQTQIALGSAISYQATVTNNAQSPASATGTTLTISYPAADLTLQAVTPPAGTCTSGAPIVCTIGSLAPGAAASVSFTLKATNRGGNLVANVTANASAAPLDYNTSNNLAAQATMITGSATPVIDLAVTQTRTPNPDPVAFNANAVYSIVVANNGPSDATAVTLTDVFTAAAGFVSVSSGQGICSNAG